jgi:hypothetical protein
MSLLGITADDFGDGAAVDIWPDNVAAHNAFVALSTQWNQGFGGPTGLKYESIPITFQMVGIPRAEWPELFEDMRVMEDETLRHIARERAKQ